MNCEKSRDLFSDYLGEELSQAESAELQLHLKSCEGCRREMALLGHTKSALRLGWPEEVIPQRLTFSFPNKSRTAGWSERWQLPRFVWFGATAAVCAMLLFVTLALIGTRIEYGQQGFVVSLGRSAEPDQPAPDKLVPVAFSAEELDRLIERRAKQWEELQAVRLQEAFSEEARKWDARRSTDLQRIAAELKYLESAQKVVYQAAVMNDSNIQSLAREMYAKTGGSIQ